jgi:Carboxypeptidase regulatory-like domain/TonB-dependent Receptor Plug Domain/TonB dependent receptor
MLNILSAAFAPILNFILNCSIQRKCFGACREERGNPVRVSVLRLLIFVCFCLLGVALPAGAQVRFGSVVGYVADQSQAAVAAAAVTLTNTGTNERRVIQTDSAGNYSFANVAPGAYSVDVEKSGFKHFTQQNVEVNVDVAARVDATLEVGSLTQNVVVSSEAITLQTDSSSLGSVVNQNTVENVPVSGRNVNNLLTLVPGVQAGGSTYGTASGNQGAGSRTNSIAFGNYFIGGSFGNQSAFFVDGVPSNGPANNVNGMIPSQDIVQEFKVVTNNVSAEYGNYAGGVVNLTTKSGSNAFHGDVYNYLRNTVLNANDFFSKLQGLPRATLIQNQFGGTVGGPIQRDRTFFFFGYDGTRSRTGVLSTSTLPTQAEINGDFSNADNNVPSGTMPVIYDPTTGNPFLNNVIPAGRVDQDAVALLKLSYPYSKLPTVAKLNNYVTHYAAGGVQNQYDARVDHNIDSKDLLFGRYTYWKVISPPYDAWGTHTNGQGATGLYSHQAVLGNTYTINPTTIADVRAFFVRIFQNEAPDSTNISLSQFGSGWATIQPDLVGGPTKGGGSYPSLGFNSDIASAFTGVTSLSGTNGVGSQLYWMQNILGTSGTLVKTLGAHQLNMGANIKRVQWISEANTQDPGLTFDPIYTSSASATSGTTGSALASMLLDAPLSTSVANVGDSAAYYWTYGLFLEDTYQASHKLTATFGVRWDQPSVYSESHNNDEVFLPNHVAPVGSVTSYQNPVTGATETLMGLLTPVATPAWPSQREDDLHWKLFAPRAGLAYRLNNLTVIRAGYGLSYLPPTLAQDGPGRTPIISTSSADQNLLVANTSGTVNSSSITATVENPFPGGVAVPPGRNASPFLYYGATPAGSPAARVPGNKYAYQQQWNFAVERQTKNGTISVAYAGSKGTHLLLQGFATNSALNINQVPDQYLNPNSPSFQTATQLSSLVTNPFAGVITSPATNLSGPTVPEYQLLKPFPQYDRVNALDPRFGYSSYSSLQVSYRERLWAGGQAVVAYTWSKLMSNTDNVTNFLDAGFILGGSIQDNDNVAKGERSLSEYDIPQSLSFGYTLPLPIGKGRAYLHSTGSVVSNVISGWDLQGLTTISSGPPVAIALGTTPFQQNLGMGNGGVFNPGPPIRPNVVVGCDKQVSGSREYRALNGWYNPNCFVAPTVATAFGDEPRVDANIRIDYTNNWDLALSKDISLTERVKMQFRVQAYNLANRAQFAGPLTIVGPPPTVTATAHPPRNIEFALRFTF